ncbi:MAG: hypothetical protein V4697_00440 [Patescibacteria group bacterium]
MDRKYPKTPLTGILNTLSRKQEEYQRQQLRLATLLSILRANVPGTITYQIHIREAGTEKQSIMGPTSTLLSEARKKGIKLWQEHNRSREEPHVEAFMIGEGLIVPLHPTEAVDIARSEDKKTSYKESQFMLNNELLRPVVETVRLAREKLPGWYNEEETLQPKH